MNTAVEAQDMPKEAARPAAGGFSGFVRGPWAIAVHTWREGIRKKTLVGFLVLSLLVIFGANVITAFLTELPEAGEIQSDVNAKLIKDICLTAVSIFGVLIAIFVSATTVPNEVESRVAHTVLSKPLHRFQYLLGKFVGAQLLILVNLALMGFMFFMAIYYRQDVAPTLILWSLLLTYCEFLVVSALTFAIACAASSSILPIIGGLFIYTAGHLTQYLQDVADRTAGDAAFSEKLVGGLAWGLYNVVPNLERFSLRDQVVYLQPNDPPSNVLIPWLIVYAVTYALAGYVLGWLIFRKREL